MQTERLPQFADDVTQAYATLANFQPHTADAFLNQVETTIDRLGQFPHLGRERPNRRKGLRSFPLRDFPFVVFYRVVDDTVKFSRLVHGARDQRRIHFDEAALTFSMADD